MDDPTKFAFDLQNRSDELRRTESVPKRSRRRTRNIMPTNKAEIHAFRLTLMSAIPASPQAKLFTLLIFLRLVVSKNMQHVCFEYIVRHV